MARKLVKNEFWTFLPPPQKKLNLEGVQQNVEKNEEEKKLFKIAWNGEKIGRKRVLDFLAPTKKNLGGVQIFFFTN